MTKGRKEIPPGEQLLGLRKARDRYQALADQVRDDIDLLQQPEEKLTRERDARRIAQAYEKSIQNMVTSCRIRRIDTDASESGSVAVKFALAAFFVVAAGGTVLAVTRPAIPQALVARIVGTETVAAAPLVNPVIPVSSTTQMIFPAREWSAVAPPALSTPQMPLAVDHPAAPAGPPVHVAERGPQKAEPAKAPTKASPKASDSGEHIMVKVLQADGSLKEQSFSAAPSH
jgi:hypothetical protein